MNTLVGFTWNFKIAGPWYIPGCQLSFQIKQFRMGASSLFGKCTEETVPQAELRGKGLCKEYSFHSYPLCVWQHVTCVFRGCHGWGSLIDSSVGPVVHTVAVGGSNSFYFHLVINYLLSIFNNKFEIPSRWPHLSQCLVGCPIHAHPAKAMSHDHVLPP